jgi:uncharacterized damage-inducible protein DinB
LLSVHYRAMARYNHWMNRRLYESCAALSDDDRRRDRGAFFRSVHGTLNHILLADRAWLGRFTGDPARFRSLAADRTVIEVKALDQELYRDFAELRRERDRTDDEIDRWVESLSDAAFAAPLTYRTMNGQSQEHPAWWALSHFFNHQTHHRGQVTTLLKQCGIDPGVTDLLQMLRAEPVTAPG